MISSVVIAPIYNEAEYIKKLVTRIEEAALEAHLLTAGIYRSLFGLVLSSA